MACAVRTFSVPTDVIGTTLTVNDCGFDPDFVIVMINGRTESVDTEGRASLMLSIGVASSNGTRRVVATKMQDAVDTSATDRAMQEACIIQSIADDGTSNGLLDIDAWVTGGIRFIVDEQFSTAYTAVAFFLSGITASFATFTDPGSTGNQDITGLGDNLEAVLLMNCSGTSAVPYLQAGSGLSFGVAANLGGVIQNAVIGTVATEADTSPNSRGLCRSGTSYYGNGSNTATDMVGSITARITDGVRLNITTAKSGRRTYVVGLKGLSIRIATIATQTNTSTTFGSGSLGFPIHGGLVVSASRAEDTTTVTVDAAGSIGAWDSLSASAAICWMYDDASDPSVCGTAIGINDVYVNLPNTADAAEGRATVSSVAGDTVNFVMNDADPSSFFGWSLIFGEAAASSQAPRFWRWRN